MAVSGTVGTVGYMAGELIEDALRLCGIPAETAVAQHYDIGRKALNRMLSASLPQQGLQLWTVEKLIFGFQEGQAELVLPIGTLDVDSANLRTVTIAAGTIDTVSATQIVRDFGSGNDQSVASVGFTSASAQTLKPVVSVSDDNATWSQVASTTVVCVAGGIYWVDLDPVNAHRYIKLVDATGANLNITSGTFKTATDPREIELYRMSQDEYDALPMKPYKGTTLQYWLDRQRDAPVMRLWPAADATTAATRQIAMRRKRHVMDVVALTDSIDVPQSWRQAVVDGLAYQCGRLIKEVDKALLPNLKQEAMESLALAQNENRDASPLIIIPDLSPYTR